MANSLAGYVTKFTNKLDETLLKGPCTSDLNMNQDLLGEMSGAGEIKIAKIAMDGLADHTRGGGFVRGKITTDWETLKLEFDRDREFSIDSLDDEERDVIVSANIMKEFAREKVVPEVDAIRFAKLASKSGATVAKTLSSADDAFSALLTAEEAIEDLGGDLSKCILYCTSAYRNLLRKKQNYDLKQGEYPNGKFVTFDDMKIVTVPQTRFYTAIDLLDGVTKTGSGETLVDETPGGYKKASTAKNINFMVVDPRAAAAIAKHQKLRYFAPDTNQSDDAHLWQYRLFHDLLVYENKKGLIYTHTAA